MALNSDKFPLQKLWDAIDGIKARLSTLEMPSGTSIGSLVAQVQAALANINATVSAAIAANSYTKTQIDSKIASPGTIAPGDVNATGTVTAAVGVSSPGVYNNLLTTAYKVQYINSAGPMGYVPSSRQFKQDIHDAPDVKQAALAMRIVTFRYIQAVAELGDEAAIEWGVIAEEIDALGLQWLVDYDENGKPQGVKYERLVLAVVPIVQDHEARLAAAGL